MTTPARLRFQPERPENGNLPEMTGKGLTFPEMPSWL